MSDGLFGTEPGIYPVQFSGYTCHCLWKVIKKAQMLNALRTHMIIVTRLTLQLRLLNSDVFSYWLNWFDHPEHSELWEETRAQTPSYCTVFFDAGGCGVERSTHLS